MTIKHLTLSRLTHRAIRQAVVRTLTTFDDRGRPTTEINVITGHDGNDGPRFGLLQEIFYQGPASPEVQAANRSGFHLPVIPVKTTSLEPNQSLRGWLAGYCCEHPTGPEPCWGDDKAAVCIASHQCGSSWVDSEVDPRNLPLLLLYQDLLTRMAYEITLSEHPPIRPQGLSTYEGTTMRMPGHKLTIGGHDKAMLTLMFERFAGFVGDVTADAQRLSSFPTR